MDRSHRSLPASTVALALLTLSAAICAADEPTKAADATPIRRITIHPTAEPRPALRYRLLPPLIDQKPGNAAVFYGKAALLLQQKHLDQQMKKVSEWMETPLDKFPRQEAAAAVAGCKSVLDEIDYAVLREGCDWQMPVREGFPYEIVLPELQEMRNFARLLAAKARLEIAEGKLHEAIATLRTGYALARHAAHGPTFIHVLVGIATAGILNGQALDLAGQPDAPNLYWALSVLPQPFISIDMANEFEKDSFYFWHPEWRHLEGKELSPAEWRAIYDQLVENVASIDEDRGEHRRWYFISRAVKGYGRAKRWLVERGRSAEAVELMPVAQVVVLHTLGLYDELSDRYAALASLAYPQVAERWSQTEESTRREARASEIIPLASLLVSTFRGVKQAQVRLERQFALHRAVEALRLYAAEHDGQLPQQLTDMTDTAVPDDPWMGGPFDYSLSGDTATLKAKLPPGMPAKYLGIHYEITVAGAK